MREAQVNPQSLQACNAVSLSMKPQQPYQPAVPTQTVVHGQQALPVPRHASTLKLELLPTMPAPPAAACTHTFQLNALHTSCYVSI